ncbi:hypothetical protein [Kaistella jeonii]|uniref:hypothetical protein n=1 Tax=Kaistella jeonii TaxID=266749 RepID=UPI00068F399B|nr:hypothetical protein [Kaistella jeonii]SFC02403.1 hypothetical protein SAMN05421876_10588 [Kaistella jeonii]VEI96621.1 Uncharacterised protein [Kaistella jeonii]
MKNIYIAIFALFFLNSCSKSEQNSSNSGVTKTPSTEISQVQKPLKMKNNKGEEVTVTYFAEGDAVAVKIQKTGGKEEKLSAKTSNENGNPIFTNQNFMWEMTQEGKGGKLTDKEGISSEYK